MWNLNWLVNQFASHSHGARSLGGKPAKLSQTVDCERTLYNWGPACPSHNQGPCWHRDPAGDTFICAPRDPKMALYSNPGLSQLQSAGKFAGTGTRQEKLPSEPREIPREPYTHLSSSFLKPHAARSPECPVSQQKTTPPLVCASVGSEMASQLAPALPALVTERSISSRDLEGNMLMHVSRARSADLSLGCETWNSPGLQPRTAVVQVHSCPRSGPSSMWQQPSKGPGKGHTVYTPGDRPAVRGPYFNVDT